MKPLRHTLFVVGQAGTADYLAPLWRRWLNEAGSDGWRIVAHPAAVLQINRLGLASTLPVVDAWTEARLAALLRQSSFSRLVCSASREPVEAAALQWAKENGVPALHLLDALYGFAWRSDARAGVIAVIDNQARDEAVAEGLPADRLAVAGHPAWEAIVPMQPASLTHWLFLDQPIAAVRPDLGYNEQDAWRMTQQAATLRPQEFERLIYVPHPARGPKPALPEGTLPMAELLPLQDAIRQCGTVAGVYSSGMVEAFLGGRRVVSLLPKQGELLCPLARRAYAPVCRSPEDLVDAAARARNDNAELRQSLAGSLDRLDEIVQTLA